MIQLLYVNIYFVKKILLLYIFVVATSCRVERDVDLLKLYSGAKDFQITQDGKIAFLCNLKEYKNILALCYISFDGELLDVIPVDKDDKVDVVLDYINLFNLENEINVIYEKKSKRVVIDSFNKDGFVKEKKVVSDSSRYGSIFNIDGVDKTIFLRGSSHFKVGNKLNYTYNYYKLDKDLNVKESSVLDLGELYPRGITVFSDNVYYFLDDRKLNSTSLKTGKSRAIYKFPEDIISIKPSGDYIAILLNNSLFTINKNGDEVREYKFSLYEQGYNAVSIINADNRGFMIHFQNRSSSVFKSFSIGGNQTGSFTIKREALQKDVLIFNNLDSDYILYSDSEKVYLKSL